MKRFERSDTIVFPVPTIAVTTINVDGLLETNEVEDVTHNTQDKKQPAEKSATNKFKPPIGALPNRSTKKSNP